MNKDLNKVAINSFSNGWLCGAIFTAAGFALYVFGTVYSMNKYTK